MTELVSIIIPAYNAEKWIKDTIESALSQTWPNKEIIVVDDGSTDNTLSILKKFESKTVKVVAQENRGACSARNKALAFAQGDYIQWLDADDILAPDKISQQMELSDLGLKSRTLLTASFAKFHYHWQYSRFIPNSLWQDLEPVEWLIRKLGDNVWLNPATWLVSRRLTEMTGLWDERLLRDQDGEYICRVVGSCEKVRFVKKAKCYYRIGNVHSVSMKDPYSVSNSYLLSGTLCFNYLRSLEDSKRTRTACFRSLQHRLLDFYPDNQELVEKANKIAQELGVTLSPPKLNWKYAFIKKIFGWKMVRYVKRVRIIFKSLVFRNWEKIFYNLTRKQSIFLSSMPLSSVILAISRIFK
jgi:glycosyltransferase involved in cell wall biosynthesis